MPRPFLDFAPHRISGSGEFRQLRTNGTDLTFWTQLAELLDQGRSQHPNGGIIGYIGYEATSNNRLPSYDICRLTAYDHLDRIPIPVSDQPSPKLTYPAGPDKEQYRLQIEAIQEYIRAGDIYQANLTHEFRSPTVRSPEDIYNRLRSFGATPRGALLDYGDLAVISNSPETFLTLKDVWLQAQPIKGTISRGDSPSDDEAHKLILRNSVKDRAENVMIVDLLRNDLGRVCEYGTVTVPELFEVKTFPTLHHLVSTVQGELRQDKTALDAFLACFPCGSITGAPKIRAMEIIDEIETVPRGVPMGAIGYFGFDGSMEWNVAIRTAVWRPDITTFHAGGGIVADSHWESEYEEMMLKATALWSAAFGDRSVQW